MTVTVPLDLRRRLQTLLDDIASGRIGLTVDYLSLADPSDTPRPSFCARDADCRMIAGTRHTGYCRQLPGTDT